MPPTGSTVPRERQLPAHGRVPPHRLSGQRRDQGDGQRHPPPTGRPSTGRPRPGARARPSYRRTWRRRRGALRASAPTSSRRSPTPSSSAPPSRWRAASRGREGTPPRRAARRRPRPVAAKPRATPGRRGRAAISSSRNLGAPEPRGHPAAEPVDAVVEDVHARLARVAADQELEGGRRERQLIGQPMLPAPSATPASAAVAGARPGMVQGIIERLIRPRPPDHGSPSSAILVRAERGRDGGQDGGQGGLTWPDPAAYDITETERGRQ